MIISNVFQGWKKGCYIASLIETRIDQYGNEINKYEKPNRYEFNIQPASGSTDVALYGERISKMYKTIVPFFKFSGVFKEGDKAYLEDATPVLEAEGTYGSNANYKIVSVRPQNTAIMLYFEKI